MRRIPNVVIGSVSGAAGSSGGRLLLRARADTATPPTNRSAQDWIELFKSAGVEIKTGAMAQQLKSNDAFLHRSASTAMGA